MPVLDMIKYHEEKKNKLKERFSYIRESLSVIPELIILTDGKDEKCYTYMKSKIKYGEDIGVKVNKIIIDNEEYLYNIIEYAKINKIPTIMQLPIKNSYKSIYDYMAVKNDVDGMFSFQELSNGDYNNVPATALGCLNYIKSISPDLKGKNCVVVGRGKLVGYPLAMMLINEGATVSVLNSKTDIDTKYKICKNADFAILATGVKGSCSIEMFSNEKDVYILNVGTIYEDGKLQMELDTTLDDLTDFIFYTPRIKGVGILTVSSLFENVANFYLTNYNKNDIINL